MLEATHIYINKWMEKVIDWNRFTQAEDEKCLKVVYGETHVLSGESFCWHFCFFHLRYRI